MINKDTQIVQLKNRIYNLVDEVNKLKKENLNYCDQVNELAVELHNKK